MKQTGLVLSGGGARGLAHLGVLHALEEVGIRFSSISGSSAGAIIGVFYSEGMPAREILEIARSRKFFGFSNFHIGKAGLFDMKTFENVYLEYFPHNAIEKLKIPVSIAATDIINGEIRYFQSGNLSKALMASSCVPLVFQPVDFEDTIYLDGSIINNFPIEPILETCEQIIGIHVNSISKKPGEMDMMEMMDRSFHCALLSQLSYKKKQCTVFIEPPEMSRFGMFDLSKMDEIFEFAYRYTMSQLSSIESLLK